MTGLYLPGAAWRPISYRGNSGTFATGRPLGHIPHVQVGNGGLWSFFEHLPLGSRKFSTAWIAKNGHSEQYAETNRKPWSQGDGNPDYLAFECEGYPNEPYTKAQIEVLARWHIFCGTSDHIANRPGQSGIGLHSMGGVAWGGHSCPGPLRASQRSLILNRVLVLRRGVPHIPPIKPPTHKIVLIVDGVFGVQSRMRLQQWAGTTIDGILGFGSWRMIQRKLGQLTIDGCPGPKTWMRLQHVVGAPADGIPGPMTYRFLQAYLNAHG